VTEANDRPTPGAKREADYLSERVLIREAHKVLLDLHIRMCGSHLKKVIRMFIQSGQTDADFRTWFLAYADPTGETAVRNVMRQGEGGQRR